MNKTKSKEPKIEADFSEEIAEILALKAELAQNRRDRKRGDISGDECS